MRSISSLAFALAALAGVSAYATPLIRRDNVVKGANFQITTHWTGNETMDATLEVATSVSTALFSRNTTALAALIADDYYGLASPSMPFNHSVFVGSAGLTELGSEASNIWSFNYVTIDVFSLAPGMALVKHWDPNAKALPSNETVPYDDIEIAFIRDGKYIETKPYYWDPYAYVSYTAHKLDKGKDCGFPKYEDKLIATKKTELAKYNASFAGF